jgi:hypothetical protein
MKKFQRDIEKNKQIALTHNFFSDLIFPPPLIAHMILLWLF